MPIILCIIYKSVLSTTNSHLKLFVLYKKKRPICMNLNIWLKSFPKIKKYVHHKNLEKMKEV